MLVILLLVTMLVSVLVLIIMIIQTDYIWFDSIDWRVGICAENLGSSSVLVKFVNSPTDINSKLAL